tara:strand:+ start:2213 stop:2440 length:228 start_codon:yes stop_codon:yes gene_type:complete
MKITNSEYNMIIGALEQMSGDISRTQTEIDVLVSKLKDEYNRLAIKNTEEGMTPEEEEIYPSRLDTQYGDSTSGR